MLCDRCGLREATGALATSTVSSDGVQTRRTEQLCGPCFAAERAESDARQRAVEQEVRQGLADGSIFEQIRAELAPVVQRGDPEELANAANYLDLLIAGLDVPVPEDLRELADRHRRRAG